MGYIVISKDGKPVNAIGPVDNHRAEWFFGFHDYQEVKETPGVYRANPKDTARAGITAKLEETLPEGLVARRLQVML